MGALGSTRRATDKTNAHLKIRTPEETRKLIEAVRKKAASGDREAQNQMVRFGERSGRPTSLTHGKSTYIRARLVPSPGSATRMHTDLLHL